MKNSLFKKLIGCSKKEESKVEIPENVEIPEKLYNFEVYWKDEETGQFLHEMAIYPCGIFKESFPWARRESWAVMKSGYAPAFYNDNLMTLIKPYKIKIVEVKADEK
jgi:hypothetical protein